ncbi:MAG: Crp/Fnr family transcriptional regulator [Candidatus Promineifilaceae bacterium]|nr:Crp/Fnr family transcriptional regulator [Candidatus Promineifilaceae bacterium]
MFGPTDSAAEALKKVPFFSELNSFDTALLVKRLVVRHFGANQIIFHLGDPAGLLYIIISGKIKISYTSADGQEAVLAILGTGDFFGELALFDDSPRSATAEAIEPTETLTLHRDEFLEFLDINPPFAHHVLTVLAKRIRHLNKQISDIFFLDLPARLARTLLMLADQHGRKTRDGIVIELSLTQTDLAEMTGATRVSINKALGRFRRAKWVKVSGREVVIIDRSGLENLIQLSGG